MLNLKDNDAASKWVFRSIFFSKNAAEYQLPFPRDIHSVKSKNVFIANGFCTGVHALK